MSQIVYEIKERIGIINQRSNGWAKELNIVSWNEGQDKFDIREWDEDHEKMTRGITLTIEEGKILCKILEDWFGKEEK